MKAFEVHVNGRKVCTAGLGGRGVLNVMIDYVSGESRDEVALTVGGLVRAMEEHVHWVERQKLQTGDEIQVKVIEAESADNPQRRFSRDAAAELKQQKQYVRQMAKRFGWRVTAGRSRAGKGRT